VDVTARQAPGHAVAEHDRGDICQHQATSCSHRHRRQLREFCGERGRADLGLVADLDERDHAGGSQEGVHWEPL
jgi:hypothetical protein